MADADLKINVTTTADLTGLKAVQTQVGTMNADIKAQLAAAGAAFDPITNSFKSVVDQAKNGATAVKEISEGFKVTRQEVAALGNELIRGEASLRSIGQSAAIFGGQFAIAATVVGAFFIAAIRGINQLNEEQNKWVESIEKTRQKVLELQGALQDMQDTFAKTEILKGLPLADQITTLRSELVRLKEEQSLVNQSTEDGVKAAKDYETQIESTTRKIETLTDKQKASKEALRDTADQTRLLNDAGNEEAQINDKVLIAIQKKYDELKKGGATEKEATVAAQAYGEAQRHSMEAAAGASTAQSGLNEMLRQANTLIQSIRQNQELIKGAPFMGADAKATAELASYQTELKAVQTTIAEIQAKKAGGALDPNELARADAELQKLDFHAKQLAQDITKAQQPLRTELQNWANNFGTTMHQLANTIEQTVGVALQGLNTWIVTGKFNAQQLLQQIEMLGLQLIEQLILQRVMAAINASAAGAQAAVTGPVVAAAWAPAATAVTVATEGEAAAAAPGEYALALGAIQAMAVAHEGGEMKRRRMHSGGLAPDEVPIIAQEGEFVVRKDVAQQAMPMLTALNSGQAFHDGGAIQRMHPGGEVVGGGGDWSPAQQAVVDRINSGRADFTFGPGSSNPTYEDKNTYVGGKFSPAGGFAVDGGVALAPQEYYLFTRAQRRALGIMDIAPRNQAGKIERYFAKGGDGKRSAGDRVVSGGRGGGPGRFPIERFATMPEAFQPGAELFAYGPGGRSGPGQVPGNVISYMVGDRVVVQAFPGSNILTDESGKPIGPDAYGGFGGVPPSAGVGPIENPSFTGSTPFGTSSRAPSGYDAQGNPVYGGQPGGFNIPGGIGLPGLGEGSHGALPPSFGRLNIDWAAPGMGGWLSPITRFNAALARGGGMGAVRSGGAAAMAAGYFHPHTGFTGGTATPFSGLGKPSMSQFHLGGSIGNLRHMHSGGGISSGSLRQGDVHVHNYTDLGALVKEMGSRKGRNIIVDTVRGNRIELGMR
jgi:hypothetical protein